MSYVYNPGDPVSVLLPAEPADAAIFGTTVDEALRQIKAYLRDPTVSPHVRIVALRARLNAVIAALGAGTGVVTPTGLVLASVSASAPAGGWLLCDGSLVSRTTYATLFAVIGVTWGVGDGATTFQLPDTRGRLVACPDNTFLTLDTGLTGTYLGEYEHVLTIPEMPSHAHTPEEAGVYYASTVPSLAVPSPKGTGINPLYQTFFHHNEVDMKTAGSDSPHQNRMPSFTLNYFIKT